MPFFVRRVFLLPLLAMVFACLSWAGNASATELGTDWVARWPNPTPNDLFSIAANGNVSLVVGGVADTLIATLDPNLTTWTRTNTHADTTLHNDWRGVAWTGSQYVAAGTGGAIMTSPSGQAWTLRYNVPTDLFQCVAWMGNKIVAAGAYPTTSGYVAVVATSTDGSSWSRRVYPGLPPIRKLVWNGQILAGMVEGAVITSVDGTVWNAHNLPLSRSDGSANTTSMVWTAGSTNPQFIVSGDSFWRSKDGVVWTEAADLLEALDAGAVLSWTGTELVSTSGSVVKTSTDQLNFTNRSTGAPSLETVAVRFNSKITFAGQSGHVDTHDTTTGWTAHNTLVKTTAMAGLTYGVYNSGTVSSPVLTGRYVAVGNQIVWTSADSNSWTQIPYDNNNSTIGTFLSVTHLPHATAPLFVAAGLGISTSSNGVTWANQVPADSNNREFWTMVSYVDGKLYASGTNTSTNAVLSKTSTNGTTWTNGTMSGLALAMAQNADGSLLVAVGYQGINMKSTDHGATWTNSVISGVSANLTGIAFDNGKFVVVDNGGGIWNYTSGTTWTKVASLPVGLTSVTRTANQFVAAGSNGAIYRSFGGVDWQGTEVPVASTINRVIYANGKLTTAGNGAAVMTSEGTAPVQATVQFTTATSTMSETGTTGALLTVSAPQEIDTQVTLSFGGTATSADYTSPGTTATIPAGETSTLIVFSAKDNNLVATNKTLEVTITAPRGDVALGDTNFLKHTITITDDDVAPAIDVVPGDQLAALGQPITLTAHATGSGNLTYVWKKNGVVIPKATTAAYTIPKAAAGDAASYTVTVTGNVAPAVTSTPATRVGVVTVKTLAPQIVKKGVNAAFPATAVAGNPADLHFKWRNSTPPLNDGGRVSGSGTNKLAISSVVETDSDTYVCDVTLGSGMGAPTMAATTVSYLVLGVAPVITPPTQVDSRVVATMDVTPVATHSPFKWSYTGTLPPGTVFNTTSGRISGKFTKAGTYVVNLTATNLVGPSAAVPFTIKVDPLAAGNKGNLIALMERHATMNADLGGRVDLTVADSGTFTGKICLPVTAKSFTGALSGAKGVNPSATVTLPGTTTTLALVLNETTGAFTATVTNGLGTNNGAGYAQAAADATKRVAPYTFALVPNPLSYVGHPEGHGFGQFSVVASGAFNVVGKLPDGAPFTITTFTGADGRIPLYLPLYSGKGSITGTILLNEEIVSSYANNFISGPISWFKHEDLGSRSYASGIQSMVLNADGGRYAGPLGTDIVMKLTAGAGNAHLLFSGGNLSAGSGGTTRNPSVNFTVASPAKATAPATNPALTTLVFAEKTGLFNGQFTLRDMDTSVTPNKSLDRTALYYGVIIRPRGSPSILEGHGFFNLAQMPTASPKTTSTTSPMLSGQVSLTK